MRESHRFLHNYRQDVDNIAINTRKIFIFTHLSPLLRLRDTQKALQL